MRGALAVCWRHRALGFVLAMLLAALALLPAGRGSGPAAAAGCWPGRPHASGTSVESISVGQTTRSYRLHVPPSYNGADRVPLVLNLHGYTSNALEQEFYSALSVRADEPDGGFIVVYPDGLLIGSVPDTQHWNNVQLPPPEPDDVALMDQLLDEIEAQLCIDEDRVFSTGMSNGAMMSIRLACSLSGRIAAIAPVAGAYYPPQSLKEPPGPFHNSAETCPDTRPVPVIAFHGTADALVQFTGGGSNEYRLALDNATPDEDVVQDWAAHNSCTSARQETQLTDQVRLIEYSGCTDGATVQLYAVDGGGHTWPDAPFEIPAFGKTTHDINATDLIWQFFQSHPMPGAPPDADTDGDTVPNAADPDNDNDGCSDAAEAGPNAMQGGQRNAKHFWDYADMPIQMLPGSGTYVRDKRVRVDDILAVLGRYFTDDDDKTAPVNRNTDPLSDPPDKAGYHPAFDRDEDNPPSPNPWNVGAANGRIRIGDILAVVNQYFHDCA